MIRTDFSRNGSFVFLDNFLEMSTLLIFGGFLRVLKDNKTCENLQTFILVRKSICFMFFYSSVCAFTIINNYYIQIKTDRNMQVQNIANKSALKAC